MKMSKSICISKDILYSISALMDELTLQLSSAANYKIDSKMKHIEIYRKYYEYGRRILHSINLAKEIPMFEIKKSDLSSILISQLEDLDEKTLNEVIIDAIANLYESISFEYYHKNGIRGKIRWKIIE